MIKSFTSFPPVVFQAMFPVMIQVMFPAMIPAMIPAMFLVLLFGGGEWARVEAEDYLPTTLKGFDVLGRPNQQIKLQARLQTGEFFHLARDIPQASVQFFFNEQPLDTVQTDPLGIAILKRIVPEQGDYDIQVYYRGEEPYEGAEGYFRLIIRNRKAPLLMTDIEQTLILGRTVREAKSLDTVPLAASTLRKLVVEHSVTVLYWTDQTERYLNVTRDWLLDQGFPPGPIFCWDALQSPLSSVDSKRRLLKRLRKEWPNLRWGVSGKEVDLEIYQESGIQPIRVGKQFPTETIPGVHQAGSWEEVEKIFNNLKN